jgi:hypothetical protein
MSDFDDDFNHNADGFTLITEEMLGIDNRKVEFKTFIIATEDDYFTCEWDYIVRAYPTRIDEILAKVNESEGDSGYIGIGDTGSDEYFEIQWD